MLLEGKVFKILLGINEAQSMYITVNECVKDVRFIQDMENFFNL